MFAHRKAAAFRERYLPQSDEQFVLGCGLAPGSGEASRALAIRRAMGTCGSIEPELIHHDHRWPEDLGTLGFWDSIDYLGFVLEVERELGVRVPSKPGPEEDEFRERYYSRWVVSDLVQSLLRMIVSPSAGA
jgi:acyl carrier protein